MRISFFFFPLFSINYEFVGVFVFFVLTIYVCVVNDACNLYIDAHSHTRTYLVFQIKNKLINFIYYRKLIEV